MRIAICSDIHDNIWALERALPQMADADALVFCGDFCAPFTLAQMAQGFRGPVHAIFGNNDGDPRLLMQMAQQAGNVILHGQFAELEFGAMILAVTHYPEIARGLAASGHYQAVCYGHDHRLFQERIGRTLLINPGEIMGRFGRRTFVVLDTESGKVAITDVE